MFVVICKLTSLSASQEKSKTLKLVRKSASESTQVSAKKEKEKDREKEKDTKTAVSKKVARVCLFSLSSNDSLYRSTRASIVRCR